MTEGPEKPVRRAGRYGSYRRVIDHYIEQIDSGIMIPGDKLPSGLEIQEQWGISHATATKAIRLLREGLYVKSTTAGVVVRYTRPQRLLHILCDTLNELEHESQQLQLEDAAGVACVMGRDGGVCWNPQTEAWEIVAN